MVYHKLVPQEGDSEEQSPLSHFLAGSSITRRLGQQWTDKALRHRFALGSGPSGVGKSILMHQVVVPALRNEDANAPIIAFMPSDSPLGFFDSLWKSLGNSEQLPAKSEEALSKALISSSPTGRSILVIDGLDQIFSQSESEAARALAFLWELVQQGSATVIGALRCPFLGPICRILSDHIPADDFLLRLTPPDEEDRNTLAREGVQLASPQLETTDPSVFNRLIREITRELDQAPQALTFLAPLLERWRSQVVSGDLSVMNFLRSNGLAGEIAVHIEEKFSALKPRLRKQLEPLLHLLVSWSDELSPVPCHVSYDTIQALGPDATELTNVLLYERVLYLSGDDTHAARVKLSHPGVLQQWAQAREILDEKYKELSAIKLLNAQALHWDSHGRRPEDQWLQNDVLLTAQTLLQKEGGSLPRITAEFLKTFEETASENNAPMRKLRQMVKPLSMLLILFAIMRGLVVITHANLGATGGPVMKATASSISPDSADSGSRDNDDVDPAILQSQ